MKTERSETSRATANAKGDAERAEAGRERDPDAFERLVKRGRDRKTDGGEAKTGTAMSPSGDIGDEESWRGRIVDGEVQTDRREQRRGQVAQERATNAYVETRSKRERQRDEVQESGRRERRSDERVDEEIRRPERPAKRRESETQVADRAVLSPQSESSVGEAEVGDGRTVEQLRATGSRTSAAAEDAEVRRSEVAQIADQIVESARTGFDAEGRKLLTMTLEIPGRGRLEVRMRKHGSKMQVELSAESPAFGRLLRRNRKDLKQQTRQRGVQLSSVRVSR
ncbi:MAG: flagellar hook-length control protein FliK [Myxococcota bacterium]